MTLSQLISAGSDYRPVTTTLTFSPEDERECFQVPILVDQLNEGKEDFIAVITSVPDNVQTTQPNSATISILDINGERETPCKTFCSFLNIDFVTVDHWQ